MSVLSYNEIVSKKIINYNNEPYEVLSSWVFRKQQRKPVNQTKLRNIKTGKVTEHSFHQAETVVEADIQTKKVMYLFQKPSRDRSQNEFWFHENENPAARFTLTQEKLGINPLFLKQNAPVDALVFADEIIGISLPIKLTLMVTEAPPSIRGSTAQGGNKVEGRHGHRRGQARHAGNRCNRCRPPLCKRRRPDCHKYGVWRIR